MKWKMAYHNTKVIAMKVNEKYCATSRTNLEKSNMAYTSFFYKTTPIVLVLKVLIFGIF